MSPRRDNVLLIFARSQLGKYLPGNVVHIAGRHLLARELGYSHVALLLSTVFEFAGLLSAAGSYEILAIFTVNLQLQGRGYLLTIGLLAPLV